MNSPSEQTKKHVIANYVEPARSKGERVISVRVGNVQKELGWTNRTPSVFSTLSSKAFMREAGVELLEKKDGPASGGPSTTWLFVYELASDANAGTTFREDEGVKAFYALRGIGREIFAQFGGGEAYLKAEREEFTLPSDEYYRNRENAENLNAQGNTEETTELDPTQHVTAGSFYGENLQPGGRLGPVSSRSKKIPPVIALRKKKA
jgi:hypothetical protein